MRRLLPGFFPLPCLLALLVLAHGAAARQAEVAWDDWGVPHIRAPEAPALFYAFARSQMQMHGDLILQLYGEARGRASEYRGEAHLDSDRWVRRMGVPRRARAWLAEQSPEVRGWLEAFAAGINDHAREHPEGLSEASRRVLPVEAADVLAHGQRIVLFHFVVNRDAAVREGGRLERGGSNAWAIAPRRSASGNALLLLNPHLPWQGFFLFFEAHLVSPGLDFYGVSLVGQPFPGMGFNDHLGWAHTVNTHDGADFYELQLQENGYLWDGAVRAFDEEHETIKIRRPDGSFREEPLRIRHSVHGPVVEETASRALALRVAGLGAPKSLEQYWAMARSRNLREFERALARLQIPMFTVMYADREGHIMHFFGGLTPVRPAGGYPWSRTVPGHLSATLWTETHRFEELPRVVDPPTGWLQNANDPPWTTTLPRALDRKQYPPYLAPSGMGFRPQRSARMLAEDGSITFEELLAYKHDTRSELAERMLDDLGAAVRNSTSELAQEAMAVLDRWDRCTENQSVGAVLFAWFRAEWVARAGGRELFATRWSEADPLATPDGLADPRIAVAALEAAARSVRSRFGTLEVPWGEVVRLRGGPHDLPANGGPDELGIFRATAYREERDGRFKVTGGDTFVAAIEFSRPVRARALLAYGNSSRPDSPHYFDQLPLYSKKELRPVHRSRREIEKQTQSRQMFRYPRR